MLEAITLAFVIPAKAGTQCGWQHFVTLDSRVRGNDDWYLFPVSKRMGFDWIVNFLCYLTASAAFTLMVAADGQMAGFNGPSVIDPLLPESVRYGVKIVHIP